MDKTETLLKESQALIEEAERKVQETDALLKSNGIARGAGRKFINSNRVPPAERTKTEEELKQFQQELEDEVQQATRTQQPSGPASSFTPRRGIPV